MGTNLDPRVTDPKRRYEADGGKKLFHRQGRDPVARDNFLKNAGRLFGESPNLRKKK